MKMNYSKLILLSLFGFLLLGTNSCTKDSCTRMVTYTKFTPVYKTLDEMQKEPAIMDAKSMVKTGKIYVFGDYLLINELNEGIHIIDNTNPANPVNVKYISIPGNLDVTAHGTKIYADSYFDLLTIDMSNPLEPVVTNRLTKAFPEGKYYFDESKQAYVVDQLEEEVTEEVDCDDYSTLKNGGFMPQYGGTVANGGSSNIAGSMSSMSILGEYLYLLQSNQLLIFSLDANLELLNTIPLYFGPETLFPYQDKLFIGGRSGMYIYDYSDPVNPVNISRFGHFGACDPVYVDNDIAYVTLRDGTLCSGATNQLDVLDVSDIMNPVLIKTFPMYHPKGLSVDNGLLYLCDGGEGLKVFEINDLHKIDENLKDKFSSIDAFDVIRVPSKNLIIVIGKDGLYQFTFTGKLHLLSQLKVNQ